MTDVGERKMIEVRIVFGTGEQVSRVWTWADIEGGAKPPDLKRLPAWAREPHRSWTHPQDPVTYAMLCDFAHEAEAREWLEEL